MRWYMLIPIWEEEYSKYKLSVQVTHCRAITYLWLMMQESIEGMMGKERAIRMKQQAKGGDVKWKKDEIAQFGKVNLIKYQMAQEQNGGSSGIVKGRATIPALLLRPTRHFYSLPLHMFLWLTVFEEVFILNGKISEYFFRILEMVKVTTCQTQVEFGKGNRASTCY